MSREPPPSFAYPRSVTGAAFRAEIGFKRLRFWLPAEGERRTVNTSSVESVQVEPNGYTKIVVRLGKDLVIPSSQQESTQLVRALNAVISEVRAAKMMRERQAAAEMREKEAALGRLAVGPG